MDSESANRKFKRYSIFQSTMSLKLLPPNLPEAFPPTEEKSRLKAILSHSSTPQFLQVKRIGLPEYSHCC